MENKAQVMKYLRREFKLGLKESLQVVNNIDAVESGVADAETIELIYRVELGYYYKVHKAGR